MFGIDAIIWVGIAAILASAVSTGVTVDAQVQQAKAQAAQLKEQARVTQAKGYAEEERLRDLNRRRLRKMREAIGTSGVRADLGTPLDTYLNEVGGAEIDAMNVRMGANYAASQARAAASNALAAGKIKAIGVGVQGAADIATLGFQGATALKEP